MDEESTTAPVPVEPTTNSGEADFVEHVECDRAPVEATEAPNTDPVPKPSDDEEKDKEIATEPVPLQEEEVPPPVAAEAESVANGATSPHQDQIDEQLEEEQQQNISDSFGTDVSLVAIGEEAAQAAPGRITPLPEAREIPEHTFDKICDYRITTGDDLHNHNLKYVNILGQVITVFKTLKGVVVLRFWDGRMLKYEKLTNLKAFRAEPAMIADYIAPAVPELDGLPSDYCLDICIYGEWINIVEKLKSGDVICIVNLHMWLPKQQRSITPTLHQGGQGHPYFRNIWLLSQEDAAAEQINRELRVTAADLKSNNRSSDDDQQRHVKKPESTVPLSLTKPSPEKRRLNEAVEENRPGPSRVSVSARREEVVVEKQVRTDSPQHVMREEEQTTKQSGKESAVRSEEQGPSTSKKSRVTVLHEEEIQQKEAPPAKKKEEHWSKNVVVDDDEIDELFAGFVSPQKSLPKYVYPVADQNEDEMEEDIGEPVDSVIVVQRGAMVEKAIQTDFKTKTVATQSSVQRKTIGLQAAIEEERPVTRSSAIQTSPEKAPPRPPARVAPQPAKENQGGSGQPPPVPSRRNIKQEVSSPAHSTRASTASERPPVPARRAANPATDPTTSANQKTSSSTAAPRRKNPPSKLQLSAPREAAPPPPPPRAIVRATEPIPPRRLASLRSATNSKSNSPSTSSKTPPRPPKRSAAGNPPEDPPVLPKRSKETPVPRTEEIPATRRSLRGVAAQQEEKPLASAKGPPATSTFTATSSRIAINERNKTSFISKICKAPQTRFLPAGKIGKQNTNIRK